MATVIERLEELVAHATPSPWTTDVRRPGGSWPYAVETPEGGIVAEDIEGGADAELIAEGRNALPDLLKVARAGDEFRVLYVTNAPMAERRAALDALGEALEPLLREVPS